MAGDRLCDTGFPITANRADELEVFDVDEFAFIAVWFPVFR